jgi:pyridoxamine 5'-phosphate oxidase
VDESALAPDWLTQFRRWYADAEAAPEIGEPSAMVLATAGADAIPGARTVLLKSVDERGFGFHTNHRSRKGAQMAENARASLVFPWHEIQRQVLVDGRAERVPDDESDAYFLTRPHASRLSALASAQGSVLGSRSELEAAHAELVARYPEGEPVPRPGWWGGWIVVPDRVEFWAGRPDRLHDRLHFRRDDNRGWVVERLAP